MPLRVGVGPSALCRLVQRLFSQPAFILLIAFLIFGPGAFGGLEERFVCEGLIFHDVGLLAYWSYIGGRSGRYTTWAYTSF
jgi:hypothetical protein